MFDLTVENVNELYWNQGLSMEAVAKSLKSSKKTISDFMIKHSIPRRTRAESIKKARDASHAKRKGVPLPQEVKDKISQTIKNKKGGSI